MLNVLDTNYQLQFSESYTGTVHRETAIEGYQYCTSLQIAFESLLSQKFTSFILTVRRTGVSIYCNGDIGFKIFDSHARDVYGRAHLQGTCVLLETLSLDSLVIAIYCGRVGLVVRVLAFHQCGPGSILALGVICGLSFLVLYSAMRGFSPGTPVFPSQQKPKFDI